MRPDTGARPTGQCCGTVCGAAEHTLCPVGLDAPVPAPWSGLAAVSMVPASLRPRGPHGPCCCGHRGDEGAQRRDRASGPASQCATARKRISKPSLVSMGAPKASHPCSGRPGDHAPYRKTPGRSWVHLVPTSGPCLYPPGTPDRACPQSEQTAHPQRDPNRGPVLKRAFIFRMCF